MPHWQQQSPPGTQLVVDLHRLDTWTWKSCLFRFTFSTVLHLLPDPPYSASDWLPCVCCVLYPLFELFSYAVVFPCFPNLFGLLTGLLAWQSSFSRAKRQRKCNRVIGWCVYWGNYISQPHRNSLSDLLHFLDWRKVTISWTPLLLPPYPIKKLVGCTELGVPGPQAVNQRRRTGVEPQ